MSKTIGGIEYNEGPAGIAYPDMKVKGINPLMTVVNQSENKDMLSEMINTNYKDNTFQEFNKEKLIDRINNKYPTTEELNIYSNKNKINDMLNHYNYSKTLCRYHLRGKSNITNKAVMPYNYDGDTTTYSFSNVYKEINQKPVDLHNFNDNSILDPNDQAINTSDNDSLTNKCNLFYQGYCELINSELKEHYKQDFLPSMLSEYEPMCKCYEDITVVDLISNQDKQKTYIKNNDGTIDIANNIQNQMLKNRGVMISENCYNSKSQYRIVKEKSGANYYSPKEEVQPNNINMSICTNSSVIEGKISQSGNSNLNVNQSANCGAYFNQIIDPTGGVSNSSTSEQPSNQEPEPSEPSNQEPQPSNQEPSIQEPSNQNTPKEPSNQNTSNQNQSNQSSNTSNQSNQSTNPSTNQTTTDSSNKIETL